MEDIPQCIFQKMMKNVEKCLLFSSLTTRPDKRALLENLVFTELLKKASVSDELYFWRTKDGAEMDFVFQHTGFYFLGSKCLETFRSYATHQPGASRNRQRSALKIIMTT